MVHETSASALLNIVKGMSAQKNRQKQNRLKVEYGNYREH
jgi:hypothetical protein